MPIEKKQFSPENFLIDAARAILQENRAPDLSGITVLLPNLQCASSLSLELRKAAGLPFVLLPGMTTFSAFADISGLEFTPESRRAAKIYLALRDKDWFGEIDLWRISRELLKLFDEMTRWRVPLPTSLPDFSKLLEKAYRARAGESLMFEARLIHELWHVMESGDLSEAAAYQIKLSMLAKRASGPLYALALDGLTPAEDAFLELWSGKAPVRVYSEVRHGFYRDVWPDRNTERDLKSRAEDFYGQASPVAATVSLFCAKSLEEEAEAAEIRIRKWLFEGKRRIALVALDRLAARRTRALLERAEILVSDETGWTFSTTSASTVLVRLLDSVASDFYHEDLLDLLKSPFIFSDWTLDAKREAVHFLEQAIRKNSIVSGLDHCSRLATESTEAARALEAVRDASRLFARRSMRLSEWLDALFEGLDILGISIGLKADLAGEALIARLYQFREELVPELGRFGFGAWRRWLDMQLEAMTFRDTGIESCVVFTHLHAVRLREFEAVVLLGCDAAHLPAEADQGLFFNQAVRAELKLPLMDEARRRQLADLSGLLCRSGEVWASWQSLKQGEPNLLSPHLEQLNAFHLHAFGMDLIDRDFSKLIPLLRLEQRRSPHMAGTTRPAPAIVQELVPESISASGYNSLLACPYQYYAARILRLAPLEEAERVLEKADYGSYLHKILYLFHSKHHEIRSLSDPIGELERLSDDIFLEAVEADYLSHGWALRWRAMIPAYIEWQLEREKQGWEIDRVEAAGCLEILLEGGRKLTLKGRIDRVDSSKEGASILDYKTRSANALKEAISSPGEDVQLAVYALLLGEPVSEAAFLSLDGQVTMVSPEDVLAPEIRERLSRIFEMMYAGVRLPAQGLEKVCEYCEMRGLCRKDYWA